MDKIEAEDLWPIDENVSIDLNKERKIFEGYIQDTWKKNFHNFSTKENGEYWFWDMQDAWNVWLEARLYSVQLFLEKGKIV